jgi:Flp pilus assembly protein TadG
MESVKQVNPAKSRARRRTAKLNTDGGAAAVEFVLVLPILLTLVFGIITWGAIFAAQISLNSAARDAARAGVVRPLTGPPMICSAIAQMARDNAATIFVAPINIGVTVRSPDGASCTVAKGASVTLDNTQMCLATSGQLVVALTYTSVSPVPMAIPSSIDLSTTGAFQCEYS